MTTPALRPRNPIWKTLFPLGVILVIVFVALNVIKSVTNMGPHSPNSVEVAKGAVLPDFTLQQFNGSEIQASQLKAKVVLVNFWATWCEACMIEMPSIVKLRKAYAQKGFEVVAINVDDNPDSVLPGTLKKFGIDFPVYLDTNSKLSDMFDVHAIPFTLIMDSDRKILMIENGERDWDVKDIHEKMDRWLAG